MQSHDEDHDEDNPGKPLTGRQTYNVITDTVGGVNVRPWDNLIQGLAICISVVLGMAVGTLLAEERWVGALAGGLIGLIAGLFVSGTALMIYRAVQHARGKHD